DGDIQTKFKIPVQSAALSPEELLRIAFERRNELLVAAERTLARLEDDDVFNRGVVAGLEHVGRPPGRLGRIFGLDGTLALLLYALYRLGIRARFRHDTSVPVLASALGRNLPAAPITDQRTTALLQSGNLAEPAMLLVRHWFGRLGVDPLAEREPSFD